MVIGSAAIVFRQTAPADPTYIRSRTHIDDQWLPATGSRQFNNAFHSPDIRPRGLPTSHKRRVRSVVQNQIDIGENGSQFLSTQAQIRLQDITSYRLNEWQ